MFRRFPRVGVGAIACAATLAGLSLVAPVSASAAPAPTSAVPAANPDLTYMYDNYNGLCLDGREGTGGVTVQRCGTDGTHEDWFHVNVGGSFITSTFEDLYNAECLDGREAPIGVTVQTCGTDGTHEWWTDDSVT